MGAFRGARLPAVALRLGAFLAVSSMVFGRPPIPSALPSFLKSEGATALATARAAKGNIAAILVFAFWCVFAYIRRLGYFTVRSCFGFRIDV